MSLTTDSDGGAASAVARTQTVTTSVRWLWVAVGVGIGAVLLGTLVPVVEGIPPRPDVAILVGALTFALMGTLVGFQSPGRTIREAVIAGVVLAVVGPLVMVSGFGVSLPPATWFMAGVTGIALSAAGGWVGEIMQGTIADGDPLTFQWVWVGVGSVLGVLLSVYSVFVLYALLDLSSFGTLLFFLGSFFVTAFVVAFYSPGSTILEPAMAAILVMILDALLALAGFQAPFPLIAVIVAAVLAFAIALAGGYVGEVAHNLYFKTAWGGVRRGVKAPKPEEEAAD